MIGGKHEGGGNMVAHRFRTSYWLALVVAVLLLLIPTLVVAQNNEQLPGNGLRISPTRVELTVERGKSTATTMTVQNVTNADITVTPFINDFEADKNETGEPQIILDEDKEPTPYSIREFVSPLKEFALKPGQKENVRVRLAVPSNTAPGSYFGVVRFATSNDVEDQGNVALAASVGTLVLVQVPGDVTELLQLEQITAAKGNRLSSFFESAPDKVVVRLRNTGNTFVKPFGRIQVKNWSGDVVHEYELNNTDPRGNVLPASVRRFENELKGVGRFGRYTIEAGISYGDGGNIIQARETFWVIPWKLLLVLIIVLVVAGVTIARLLGGYNRVPKSRTRGPRR